MSTLSDRYVWAVVRNVPEKQRREIEPEVRELIGDSIDAQRATGVAENAAERAALLELGDPSRLAARYIDRPLQLIGPRYYLDWLRLLKLLLWIVVPIVAAVAGFARVLDGGDAGEVIVSVITAGLSVAVQLCFWVTLVFAAIERYGSASTKPLVEWTPDTLPQLPSNKRPALGEMIASIAFLAVFAGWIVWQNFSSFFTDDDGNPIALLNPALWSSWLPFFLGVIALEMAFALWLYLRGRWTVPLAVANLALNAIFTIPAVVLLLSGQLINPEFVAAIPVDGSTQSDIAGAVGPIMLLTLIGVAVWDVIDGFIKTWRARSR